MIDFYYLDEEIGSPWDVFRIILEAFKSEDIITLDYTNLFEGGWCDEVPEEKEYLVSKTVILTEGSTDARVISEAMKLLYPHMVKFYSFIDFSTYVVQGSTNYLTHYLKAFIAAGIRNRIIALYDNDSAGLSEIKVLKNIPIPSNVRIMHLPDLEMCLHYPTIGPGGSSIDNINGRACSIEMFLGKDILKKSGECSVHQSLHVCPLNRNSRIRSDQSPAFSSLFIKYNTSNVLRVLYQRESGNNRYG